MTENNESFNVEAYAEKKRKKYEDLINKYKNAVDKDVCIMIEGPCGGMYKKIDDYYIRKKDSDYYITKQKYIEENKLKACVYILTDFSDKYIEMIHYWVANKDIRPPFKEKNINGIIDGLSFNSNGVLEAVSTVYNDRSIVTAEDAANEVDEKIRKSVDEIKTKIKEIQRVSAEIDDLKAEILSLESLRDEIILSCTHPLIKNKIYYSGSLERVKDTCAEHVDQLYAVKEFNSRRV